MEELIGVKRGEGEGRENGKGNWITIAKCC